MYVFCTDYQNWESELPDIGCYASGCTSLDGLVLRPDSEYTWNALVDKSTELPYVCRSQCPRGFKWYPGMMVEAHILQSNYILNITAT